MKETYNAPQWNDQESCFREGFIGDLFLAEPWEKERSQSWEEQGLVDNGEAEHSRQTKAMYTDPKVGKMSQV